MPEESTEAKDHLFSNKLYDLLKLVALIILPALGTLYVALSATWGLPKSQEVSATIVAVVAFLGVLIKIGDASYNSSNAKYDGDMVLDESGRATRIVQNGLISDDKSDLLLKVIKPSQIETADEF